MKNNEETRSLVDEYPKLNYKIKVISLFSEDSRDEVLYYLDSNSLPIKDCPLVTKGIIKFIDSILPEDILIFEYPLWFDSRYGTGVRMFSVQITNTRTGKTISIRANKLGYIYKCIEEFVEE